MNILYHIDGLCPRTDISMSRCNFSIKLFPQWKECVSASGIDQVKINTAIKNLARPWLDGCGYANIYDPDADPMAEWEAKETGNKLKLGPNARPLYNEHNIRISWGEWGPEHITVPGDACGLDLDRGIGAPLGGRVLHPHNIDNFSQVMLLLTIFTWIADGFVLGMEQQQYQMLEVFKKSK